MRVSIVGLNYWPEPTGIAPYTTGLATSLAARGHEVEVLTGLPHYPGWRVAEGYGRGSSVETLGGVSVRRFGHPVARGSSAVRRGLMEMGFGLRSGLAPLASPEVVLCVSPALLSSAFMAARLRHRQRPAIGVWVQDLYSRAVSEIGGGGVMADVTARLERRVLNAADGIVAIHERFKSVLVNDLGIDATKVAVIRNWTHIEAGKCVDVEEARRRLGWGAGETVVLHAGNMGAKQGLETVLEAARLADRSSAPVRFVLMGDGNRRRELESLGAGIARLDFVPPQSADHFWEALQSADVLLVNEKAGVREMCVPSKLTSYFSAGRPVLAATDRESITASEINASGAGVRIDPGDGGAMLDAVMALRREGASCRGFGVAGREYVERVLSEAFAVDLFEEWLAGLARVRRASLVGVKGLV